MGKISAGFGYGKKSNMYIRNSTTNQLNNGSLANRY
jgi:hypothetical protein